jgi:hypothetical protein
MAKKSKKPLAVYDLSKLGQIGNFIIYLRALIVNFTNNVAILVAPDPTVPTVTSDVTDLVDAEAVAKTRVQGAAAARDLNYDIVFQDMRDWRNYVQKLADHAPNEAAAIAIIEASGFFVRLRGVRVKPPLAVKNSKIAGQVLLSAKSVGRRASYEWQMSMDGAVWTTFDITLGGRGIVNKLKSGDTVFFRVRGILKDGELDWTAAVSIIVK